LYVVYAPQDLPPPSLITETPASDEFKARILPSVYTRHSVDCEHKKNRLWLRCNCPKWIRGSVEGVFRRWSAKTRSWQQAEEYCSLLLKGHAVYPGRQPTQVKKPRGKRVLKKARISITEAVDEFLIDAKSRGLENTTLNKLNTMFRKQMLSWCRFGRYQYLDQLDHNALLRFRSTWKDGPLSRQKKQHRLGSFFRACIRRGYLQHNPANNMGKIKVVQRPTEPFTREDFDKIITATYQLGQMREGDAETNHIRLRTLILLLRWSGLRIQDAITLERHRLHDDSLLLYQAKTRLPVYVPLPPDVVADLRNLPSGLKPNPHYFFWSGNGRPRSSVGNWQRSLRRLFSFADLRHPGGERKRCYPQMFRDTFAVELLLAGVPLDQVSTLLGHTSIKTTERSYVPFVKARQLQLQESVRNAWKIRQSVPSADKSSSFQKTRHDGWQLIRNISWRRGV
jgi:integrase/recombinase XerD